MSADNEAKLDLTEHGAPKGGKPQVIDRRLFMQLLAYECPPELKTSEVIRQLGDSFQQEDVGAVIYEDVNHPAGLAVLSYSQDPSDFVKRVRPILQTPKLSGLRLRPNLTMLGRSYSSGFEPDLEFWLLKRPIDTVRNPEWPWAVWYPLRRGGAFEKLDSREKGSVLREHATIGKRYGAANLAHDVRLACHGLDENDNEFIVGLIGEQLYPLSHVVQSMRGTRQTSEFITQMGPFFVGYRAWPAPR